MKRLEAIHILNISIDADEVTINHCVTKRDKQFRRKMIQAKKMAVEALYKLNRKPK